MASLMPITSVNVTSDNIVLSLFTPISNKDKKSCFLTNGPALWRRETWVLGRFCIELPWGFTAISFLGSVREDHIMSVFLVAHEISKGLWIQDLYFMLLHFAVMNSWFQIKEAPVLCLCLTMRHWKDYRMLFLEWFPTQVKFSLGITDA